MPYGSPYGSPYGPPTLSPFVRPPGGIPLLPPKDVTATVSGSDIDITWTAASSVDGYNIYQSIDGGTWTKLNGTTETGLTYTLTPTDPGEYNFYVTSVRGTKESAASAETTTTEAMMVQVYTDTLSPRISAVDGTAFVDLDDTTVLESGSATRDEVRVSAVDGTAFVDSVSSTFSTDLVANIGKKLVLKDSAGKELVGWIKAQGSGEALGSELVTNGDFATGDTTGWISALAGGSTFGVSAGVATLTRGTGAALAYQDILSKYGLFKTQLTVSDLIAPCEVINSNGISYKALSIAALSFYYTHTQTSSNLLVRASSNGSSVSFDDFSTMQVTAPSTSGATVVSSFNGTTYNWESQDVDFNYNDDSGYTYEILSEGVHEYADGNHLLEVQDSDGNVISGVLKAQGSGETLGSELVTNGDVEAALPTLNSLGEGRRVSVSQSAEQKQGGVNSMKLVQTAEAGLRYYVLGDLEKMNNFVYGELIKVEYYVYLPSGQTTTSLQSTVYLSAPIGLVTLDTITSTDQWVLTSKYFTVVRGNDTVERASILLAAANQNQENNYWYVDDCSSKQVTAPSTSGATLVDEISGTTQNLFTAPAGFIYGEASYTVRVKKILPTA